MTVGEVGVDGAEPSPQVIGKIETDLFCASCYYNLHGLDVRRDPRLELAIVRCPECGKFHPAGMATGAGRVWLSRLAAFLITLWVAFLLVGVIVLGFAYFFMDVISVEAFSRYQRITVTAGPAGAMMDDYRRMPIDARSPREARELLYENLMLAGCSLLAGWLLGGGGAVFLWHLKRKWLLFLMAVPGVVVMLVGLIFLQEDERFGQGVGTWVGERLMMQTALQWAGLMAGILLGRALARGMLSVVLTRKLLQHVRFLWTVDGKVPPSVLG